MFELRSTNAVSTDSDATWSTGSHDSKSADLRRATDFNRNADRRHDNRTWATDHDRDSNDRRYGLRATDTSWIHSWARVQPDATACADDAGPDRNGSASARTTASRTDSATSSSTSATPTTAPT